jgi:hypothetical protein
MIKKQNKFRLEAKKSVPVNTPVLFSFVCITLLVLRRQIRARSCTYILFPSGASEIRVEVTAFGSWPAGYG